MTKVGPTPIIVVDVGANDDEPAHDILLAVPKYKWLATLLYHLNPVADPVRAPPPPS